MAAVALGASLFAVTGLEAQGCRWAAKLGWDVPLSDLPAGAAFQKDIEAGPLVGTGLVCPHPNVVTAVSLALHDRGDFQTLHLLGAVGPQLALGGRGPRLRLLLTAGPVLTVRLSPRGVALPVGRQHKDLAPGFALGSTLEIGFPAGPGEVALSGTLLGTFVQTEVVGFADPEAALGGFASVPIALTYSFP